MKGGNDKHASSGGVKAKRVKFMRFTNKKRDLGELESFFEGCVGNAGIACLYVRIPWAFKLNVEKL